MNCRVHISIFLCCDCFHLCQATSQALDLSGQPALLNRHYIGVRVVSYIYIQNRSLFQVFGQEFFFVSASVCDSRNWNSRSNRFVRAPASGGGSNAPRPAVSVPHIDVNADGCRARQARSCKNTACRGGIPEISVVS